MAISLDIEYQGITVVGAYVKVAAVSIQDNRSLLAFSVWYCASVDAVPFKGGVFETSYDIEGANPFDQAYAHLKLLPEFTGCIDC